MSRARLQPKGATSPKPAPEAACPCGSGKPCAACCWPFLEGAAWPETAAALMRSRYTAYALGRYDWLVESTHPDTREGVNAEELARQCRGVRWVRLDMEKCLEATDAEMPDVVEFHALYELDGAMRQLGERSIFRRDEGKLYYLDGEPLAPRAYRREGPKLGRNEPCPCGSGKKYKKCCGRGSGDAA